MSVLPVWAEKPISAAFELTVCVGMSRATFSAKNGLTVCPGMVRRYHQRGGCGDGWERGINGK